MMGSYQTKPSKMTIPAILHELDDLKQDHTYYLHTFRAWRGRKRLLRQRRLEEELAGRKEIYNPLMTV
jgi:hypothetical protein